MKLIDFLNWLKSPLVIIPILVVLFIVLDYVTGREVVLFISQALDKIGKIDIKL